MADDKVLKEGENILGTFGKAFKIVALNDEKEREAALKDAHAQGGPVAWADSGLTFLENHGGTAVGLAGAAFLGVPLLAESSRTMVRGLDAYAFNAIQERRGQQAGRTFAMKMIADINAYTTPDINNPDAYYAAGNLILDTSEFFNPDGSLTPAGEKLRLDALANGNPEEFLLNQARTLVKVAFEKWAKKYKEYSEGRGRSAAAFADRHIDKLRKMFEDKTPYTGLSASALNSAVYAVYKQFTSQIDTRKGHAVIPQAMLDVYDNFTGIEKSLARALDVSMAGSIKAKDGNKVVVGFKGLSGDLKDRLPPFVKVYLAADGPARAALGSSFPEVEIPMGETDTINGKTVAALRGDLGLTRKPDGSWDLKIDPMNPPRVAIEHLIDDLINNVFPNPNGPYIKVHAFLSSLPAGIRGPFEATFRWQLFYALLGVLDPADLIKNKYLGIASRRQQVEPLRQKIAVTEGAKIKVGDDAVVQLVPDDVKKHYNPMAKALKDIQEVRSTEPGKLAEFLGADLTAVFPGAGIQLLVKRYKDRKEAIGKIRARYDQLLAEGQNVEGLKKFLEKAEPKLIEILQALLTMLLGKYAERSREAIDPAQANDRLQKIMDTLVTPTLQGKDMLTPSTDWDTHYEALLTIKLLGITEEKTEAAALGEITTIPPKLIVTYLDKKTNEEAIFGFGGAGNARNQNRNNYMEVINSPQSTPRDLFLAIKLYDRVAGSSNRAAMEELLKLLKQMGDSPIAAQSGATQLKLVQLMHANGFISRTQNRFFESELLDRADLFGAVTVLVKEAFEMNRTYVARYASLTQLLGNLQLDGDIDERRAVGPVLKNSANKTTIENAFKTIDIPAYRRDALVLNNLIIQITEVLNSLSVATLSPVENSLRNDLTFRLQTLKLWQARFRRGMLIAPKP